MIRYILFDLDETLYPPSSGLMPAIGDRMRAFLEREYALSPEDAYDLQKRYWFEYGTTLRGLMLEHEIDPRHYLDFVHDVDVKQFIVPNPELNRILSSIPYEKVIVTNADVPHAQRVLNQLGIAAQFSRIFDIVFMEYECKPARGAYERVLRALNATGAECILVEDTARNLATARELGIRTILLLQPEARTQPSARFADPAAQMKATACPPDADLCIEDIAQVGDAIAQLAFLPPP
ncbi:MAG: pyrimidine 5'-nucleotidase [Chloroflexi bacterium]|nr:pyrimidine 5'-nucleotidase [Chloroflexota bacterium]